MSTITVETYGEGGYDIAKPANNVVATETVTLPQNVANAETITSNVISAQTQIEAWIAANTNGAVLTAAQTLVLARMLNGLCRILLEQFDSTSGT